MTPPSLDEFIEHGSSRLQIMGENPEKWKEIPGYEGHYMCSTYGRVKSIDRIVKSKNGINQYRKGRILYQEKTKHGYLIIRLVKDGIRRGGGVHRFVAKTFIDNPKNKPEVNHINEVKYDNRVENLEWMTSSENTNHGFGFMNGRKKVSKSVNQYTLEGDFIKKWDSIAEIRRSLKCGSHISACCKGNKKQFKGFIWKYAKK